VRDRTPNKDLIRGVIVSSLREECWAGEDLDEERREVSTICEEGMGPDDDEVTRPASTPNADAIKVLVAIVKTLPERGNEAVFHLLKGQIYLLSNNCYLACEHLEKSLNVYREGDCEIDISPHAYSLLLQAYHEREILYRAISVSREWVERYPKVATAHAALCHLLFEGSVNHKRHTVTLTDPHSY